MLFYNEMRLKVFLYLTKQLETNIHILSEKVDMALKKVQDAYGCGK